MTTLNALRLAMRVLDITPPFSTNEPDPDLTTSQMVLHKLDEVVKREECKTSFLASICDAIRNIASASNSLTNIRARLDDPGDLRELHEVLYDMRERLSDLVMLSGDIFLEVEK